MLKALCKVRLVGLRGNGEGQLPVPALNQADIYEALEVVTEQLLVDFLLRILQMREKLGRARCGFLRELEIEQRIEDIEDCGARFPFRNEAECQREPAEQGT